MSRNSLIYDEEEVQFESQNDNAKQTCDDSFR